jgi:hypothetical protein
MPVYVTPRSFTPDAEHYAASMPMISLVDVELLNRSMQRSLRGVALPQTYRAMCCQCGEIVQQRLDRGHAIACGNGHLVPATIARDSLVKPRQPTPTRNRSTPKLIKFRNMHPKAQIRRRMRDSRPAGTGADRGRPARHRGSPQDRGRRLPDRPAGRRRRLHARKHRARDERCEFNLRLDPFERCAKCPPQMFDFCGHEFWRFVYVQQEVAALGETFVQFPPMQAPASFNLTNVRDQILEAIKAAHGGNLYGGN